MSPIFSFDWGGRALIARPPEGRPIAVSVEALQAAKWRFSEAELRKSLPRADVSRIAPMGGALRGKIA